MRGRHPARAAGRRGGSTAAHGRYRSARSAVHR
jgi:hypothetical protein